MVEAVSMAWCDKFVVTLEQLTKTRTVSAAVTAPPVTFTISRKGLNIHFQTDRAAEDCCVFYLSSA